MRRSLLALAILGTVATGNAPVNAQQKGPYYANPSWDQQIPAEQRFIVLSNWKNQAVLDKETGLVWERTPTNVDPSNGNETDWVNALQVCHAGVATGGRWGWRVPSVEELVSLADPSSAYANSLPAGHPFQGSIFGSYWTATTFPGDSAGVYVFEFNVPFGGSFGDFPKTGKTSRVWCVRGGAGVQNPQ
jgi:hypothetical protein